MSKFPLLIGCATLIIIIGGVIFFSRNSSTPSFPLPANLVLYAGEGCPHCRTVEDFLASWDKKETIKIEQKEVWYDKTNAAEIKARYEFCQTPETERGVPLLFTPDGKCLGGDQPIIDYLKNL
jgi:glutaredoxin